MSDFRAFLEKRKATKEAATATPPPKAKAKAKSPAVELPPREIVRHSCGCKIGVLYLQGQPCPGCTARRRRERNAARREARDGRGAKQGRLPHGSHFDVSYDATAGLWSGKLEVILGGQTATFEASASGVARLLSDLDGLYRSAVEQAGCPDAA